MKYTNEQLLEYRTYTMQEVLGGAIIMHPKAKGYNIKASDVAQVLEIGSNLTQLDHPILDHLGNHYRDSEGYYMASRTNDLEVKKQIAFYSNIFGRSRSARAKYELDMNKENRIEYMREAIRLKYDANPSFADILLSTYPKQIIEYTYRNDTFFGIDQETKNGQNVLGKLSMERRDILIETLTNLPHHLRKLLK